MSPTPHEVQTARDAQLQLGVTQTGAAVEMNVRFFFHWSILSGATLTLTVPLIFQLLQTHQQVKDLREIEWAIALLIISTVSSALCVLIGSKGIRASAQQMLSHYLGDTGVTDKSTKKMEIYKYLRWAHETLSIITYLTALILIFIGIFSNF